MNNIASGQWVYNPISLNLEKILPNNLSEYQKPLYSERIRLFIHDIRERRRIFQIRRSEYVPMHRDWIKKILGSHHGYEILGNLLDFGILECDNIVIYGKKSKGYKLNDELQYEKTQRIWSKIKLPLEPQILTFPYDKLWENTLKITVDPNYVNDPDLTDQAKENLRSIADKNFRRTVCEYGRFHTNIVNLESSARKYLLYNGKPITIRDIANCHPLLFGIITINKFDLQNNKINFINRTCTNGSHCYADVKSLLPKTPGETNKCLNPYSNTEDLSDLNFKDPILSSSNLSLIQNETPSPGRSPFPYVSHINNKINTSTFLKTESSNSPEDLLLYQELCSSGKFYSYVHEKTTIPILEIKERLFGESFYCADHREKELGNFMQKEFPTIMKVVRDLKRWNYRNAAWQLQRMESGIIIKQIAYRILKEKDIWITTIHDAITCEPENQDYVDSIIKEVFSELGIIPTIKGH